MVEDHSLGAEGLKLAKRKAEDVLNDARRKARELFGRKGYEEDAMETLDQSIKVAALVLTNEHGHILDAKEELAGFYCKDSAYLGDGIPLYEEVLTMRERSPHGEDSLKALKTRRKLARAYLLSDSDDKAEKLITKNVDLEDGDVSDEDALVLRNVYFKRKHFVAALEKFKQILRFKVSARNSWDFSTVESRHCLALAQFELGLFEEARRNSRNNIMILNNVEKLPSPHKQAKKKNEELLGKCMEAMERQRVDGLEISWTEEGAFDDLSPRATEYGSSPQPKFLTSPPADGQEGADPTPNSSVSLSVPCKQRPSRPPNPSTPKRKHTPSSSTSILSNNPSNGIRLSEQHLKGHQRARSVPSKAGTASRHPGTPPVEKITMSFPSRLTRPQPRSNPKKFILNENKRKDIDHDVSFMVDKSDMAAAILARQESIDGFSDSFLESTCDQIFPALEPELRIGTQPNLDEMPFDAHFAGTPTISDAQENVRKDFSKEEDTGAAAVDEEEDDEDEYSRDDDRDLDQIEDEHELVDDSLVLQQSHDSSRLAASFPASMDKMKELSSSITYAAGRVSKSAFGIFRPKTVPKTFIVDKELDLTPASLPVRRSSPQAIPGAKGPRKSQPDLLPASFPTRKKAYDRSRHPQRPRSASDIASKQPRRPYDRSQWLDAQEYDLYDSKIAEKAGEADHWLLGSDKLQSVQNLILEERKDSRKKKIKIALLDTGLFGTHPFLDSAPCGENIGNRVKGSLWFDDAGEKHDEPPWFEWRAMKKEVRNEEAYVDEDGHGTHCAGLILQIADNAELYIARVGGGNQIPDAAFAAKAIEHACTVWQVDIITMSFGFAEPDKKLLAAINNVPQDTIMFAAAGNHGTVKTGESFPASIKTVIGIRSASGQGSPANYNPAPNEVEKISMTTLGEGVLSMWRVHDEKGVRIYQKRMSGSSVAAPIAAALTALILEFLGQPDEPGMKHLKSSRTFLKERNRREEVEKLLRHDTMTERKHNGCIFLTPWKVLNLASGEEGRARAADKIWNIFYR